MFDEFISLSASVEECHLTLAVAKLDKYLQQADRFMTLDNSSTGQ
jgi:hypothetical protein